MSTPSRLITRVTAQSYQLRLSRPHNWPRRATSAARPQTRTMATLPDPRTPTGSIVLRPSPQTALDAPKLVPPPVPGEGPLLERRADRELPKFEPWWMPWAKTFPIFAALLTAAALGMFNYQKLSSSVVASILYALRTSDEARAALGGEIYFRDRVPWIWGTMNQLKGVIDVGFGVKGNYGSGFVKFKSFRKGRLAHYVTTEWSLELEDGRVLQLLDPGSADPMALATGQVAEKDAVQAS